MSKAVLVMDMPDSCMGCNFLYCSIETHEDSCQATEHSRRIYLEKEEKPDWCPLRELPEKKEVCGRYPQTDGVVPSYKIGWNACINEITREREEKENV